MTTHAPVALVTGASAGIGKATTRRLLADGYTVYAAARRVEQMRDLEQAGALQHALQSPQGTAPVGSACVCARR